MRQTPLSFIWSEVRNGTSRQVRGWPNEGVGAQRYEVPGTGTARCTLLRIEILPIINAY